MKIARNFEVDDDRGSKNRLYISTICVNLENWSGKGGNEKHLCTNFHKF